MINHTPATHQTSPLSPETLKVFETIPDLYLILSPNLTILTASDAYLAATHKRREEITGQYVFTVFPDNPAVSGSNATHTMADSYRRVIATGQPHTTDLIRYDLALPLKENTRYEARYWQVVNTPVLNERGSIHYIIHKVIDVTDRVEKDKRLEESQLREQSAQAEANRQRQQLYNILMQAPALICLFEGPDHVFKLVNPPYQQLVGERPILGKPIREAMPELAGQPIFGLLDQVYRTGESFYAYETLVQLDHDNSGGLGHNFYNFVYQPIRDLKGQIEGILVFAYEVTAQVKARLQVQTLNEELQASNRELQEAKKSLETLNTYLEQRVDRRTRELKHSQAEIQRQKARLERFFMQAPAAICIYDGPDLVYELVNPRYQQMFPGRELLHKPLLEALPEVRGHTVWHNLQAVYQTGQTHEDKALLVPLARHDNGPVEDLYFDYILQARYDEHGQIDGVMAFAFEVTEQVLARQATERAEQQLNQALQAGKMGTWHLDLLSDVSTRTLLHDQIFGYTSLLPKWGYSQFINHVLPAYREGVTEAFAHARQTGLLQVEAPIRRADGLLSWIIAKGEVFFTDGQPVRMSGIVMDTTQRKEVEQQLQTLTEQLASANEEIRATNKTLMTKNEELSAVNQQLTRINVDLDNFIYTASHDLKAPISNIESLLAALIRYLTPESLAAERTQRILTLMQESVERFKKTIASLTEVVKLQKENNAEAVSIDLLRVIREVSLDLEPLIGSAEAQIEVDVADCPSIHFSEKNLRSVIYNLMSNAIKYRSPERIPCIRIRSENGPGYCVLTVSDNGLGIEANRIHQLFTMFKRLHNHVEGTGIGLYMVKKMVENAGGKIEVTSQVEQGTTFRVYFRN